MGKNLPDNILKEIDQIKRDNTSGSIELVKKSVEVLKHIILETDSFSQVKNAAFSLIIAQPTMASIFNLVNNLMLNIEANKGQ